MENRQVFLEKIIFILKSHFSSNIEEDEQDTIEYFAEEILNGLDSSEENLEEILKNTAIDLGILTEEEFFLIDYKICEELQLIKKGEFEIPIEIEEEEDIMIEGICNMCLREMSLTKHHLIPRTMHKKYLKKGYTKDDLQKGVNICRQCHNNVHKQIPNEELARCCSTFKKLMEHQRMIKYIPWIRKQKTPKMSGLRRNYKK